MTGIFAPRAVIADRRADGTTVLRSPTALAPFPRAIGVWLERWGAEAPDRPFLLERGADGSWVGVTWGEALDRVHRLATGLLDLGLSAERPVAILSDNGVQHGLLMLAALHAGIPVAPVSPAYSLLSRDFVKLRRIIGLTSPGLVYVSDRERFAPALAAIADLHDGPVVSGTGNGGISFDELAREREDRRVRNAFEAVGPDTLAKLLFTSGSTGEPKGVVNTQRMLCSNQVAKAQVWPFLEEEPPVIVDWLPWSHTFGANHNFNLILRNGGTLYIDGGRPLPPLFGQTLANLREIAPTIYFNVPRGYDLLVAALREDEALRRTFFSRLRVIFYAAAALPQHLWEALAELAESTVGAPIPLTSAWGATETAPLATDCHYQADRAGVIGLPVPGTELKLVPDGPKLEVRVRGPNVTPGYWKRPDLTEAAFDPEGFYRVGDAVRFVDPEQPDLGVLFDGRVAEDFKLDTGTWVNTGILRVRAIAALSPVAQDIVVTGHDRSEIGLLVFPNVAGCRGLCPDLPADTALDIVLGNQAVRDRMKAGLKTLREQGEGSASYAGRAAFLAEPPSIDAGELTDKGYINQRAVLTRRVAAVEALYAGTDPGVIRLEA